MEKLDVPYVNFAAQFKELEDETMGAIRNVLAKGNFILGEQVEQFEQEFAKISKAKYAVGVGNGSDTLTIIMKALGIGPGDEVITASNSWYSSAGTVALLGATPVFADVADDQNIDPAALEKAITPRTKAIMPVHLTGRCARLPEILAIAKRKNIPVIEDAAQSVTATVGPYTAGNAGIAGSFSLHPLKNLNAVGDAGVITTNDKDLYEEMLLLRNHGQRTRDVVVKWGYNSRLDTLQAAVLLTRIPKVPEYIEKRRKNAAYYTKALKDIVHCPQERADERHTFHVYVIQCDRRNQLQSFLAQRGIDTKVHYPTPIHLQEAAKYLGYKPGSLPKTEEQAGRILSLPVHQYMTEDQMDWVIESITHFYKKL